ncbi:hypothetical protein GGI04_001078 [Coemansia thaxteri]|uniref:Uncharacterized protein n=1 Tax=Coemansia thaxteri TaxID=2663907 RepID=A0A9W8BL30_9FUNG|nr:hypothetical protein H4R26_001846 [Coemansia thaxteri]KAJ2008582.1 hypothetical protein GGI04_001078 [Coemansia thaxteri]
MLIGSVAVLVAAMQGASLPCGPVLLPDLNLGFVSGSKPDYCSKGSKGAPASECATNRDAVISIDAAIKKYKVARRGEIVAIVAWMMYESDGWKYSINRVPGVPGQGTRCMMQWPYVHEYAKLLHPEEFAKLIGTSASNPESAPDDVKKSILELVLSNNDSFGAGFWFLANKSPTYFNKTTKLRDGNLEDFKDYITNYIKGTWDSGRDTIWHAMNSTLKLV